MPGNDGLGSKISLDIREFKSGVAQLNREIRVIQSGFYAAASSTQDWANDSDMLRKRIDSLKDVVAAQNKKVEASKEIYEKVAKEKGENSKAAQDLQIKLNRETEALNKSNQKLKAAEDALEDMSDESQKAKKKVEKLETSIENMSKATDRMEGIAKGAFQTVVAGATAAVGAVTAFAWEGLGLASDLKEVQNVVDTTFGKSGRAQINTFAKDAATQFGLSEIQAKKYAGTLGAMTKSMGLTASQVLELSKNMTGLSGDFASFYNLDSEEAFNKIRAGISGETEPLKQLGINMSVASLEAYALSQGIETSYKEMSEAEKVLLRYNYLMEVSKDAQGDYAKTSDGFANKQRELGLVIENQGKAFGEKLLPAATDALNILVDGIMNIDMAVFDGVAESISNMAVSFAEAAVDAIPKIIGFAEFIMDNGNEIIALITSIAAGMVAWNVVLIVQGVIASIKKWKLATEGMTMAQRMMNLVMAANPIGIVITAVAALAAGLIFLWKTNDEFRESVISTFNNIVASIKTFAANFSQAFKDMVNNAIETVTGIVDKAKQIGRDIIDGLVNGIKEKVSSAVEAVEGTVDDIINSAKEALGIHSPSRLMDEEIGQPIGLGIAQGIDKSKDSVQKSMDDLLDMLKSMASEAKDNIENINADLQETINTRRNALDSVSSKLRAGKISAETAQWLAKDLFSQTTEVPEWISKPTSGADDPRISEYKKQSIIEQVNINVKTPAEAIKEIEILDKQLATEMG